MRARIAILLVAAVGCSHQRPSTRTSASLALVGFAVAAGGTTLWRRVDSEPGKVTAAVLIGTGAVFALVHGAIAFGAEGAEPEPPEVTRAFRAAAARRAQLDLSRARAWQLTKASAAAARAGDCHVARDFDDEIDALDPEFHDVVFLRDAAIARCLAR
jgi:hypothetical protein